MTIFSTDGSISQPRQFMCYYVVNGREVIMELFKDDCGISQKGLISEA